MTICQASGKEIFNTRPAASERAAHLNKRGGETRKVYFCDDCNSYHVGGEAKRKRSNRK